MTTKLQIIDAKRQPLMAALQLKTLRATLTNKQTEIQRLERQIHLDELDTGLDTIARLRTLVSIIPKRIDQAEQELIEANESLKATSLAFVNEYLRPRLNNQLQSARATVSQQLKSILVDAAKMDSRIESSALVSEVKSMIAELDKIAASNEVEYADKLLALCEKSEEFEQMETRLNGGAIWNRLLSPAIEPEG